MANLNDVGHEYQLSHLEESDLAKTPMAQFDIWMKEALAANIPDATAFVLSTVDQDSQVSSRVVLLKYYDDNGLVFFTNYNSPKAKAIEAHPGASALFWWPQFERQVRVQGTAHKIAAKYSDEYFAKRDKNSNIAAVLSRQSEELEDKQAFIEQYKASQIQHEHSDNIPRPEYWGGLCLSIETMEFWQGGSHRIHDRLKYSKQGDGWKINRLYP